MKLKNTEQNFKTSYHNSVKLRKVDDSLKITEKYNYINYHKVEKPCEKLSKSENQIPSSRTNHYNKILLKKSEFLKVKKIKDLSEKMMIKSKLALNKMYYREIVHDYNPIINVFKT